MITLESKLAELPPKGRGGNCHIKLFNVARWAARNTNASENDLTTAITEAINAKDGDQVSESYVRPSVIKALLNKDEVFVPRRHVAKNSKTKEFKRYVNQTIDELGSDACEDEADAVQALMHSSPVSVMGLSPLRQSQALLNAMFLPEETIFIGDTYGKFTKPMENYGMIMDTGAHIGEQFAINPFNPESVDNNGGPSFRCNASVSAYRHVLCEFDDRPILEQILFWYSFDADIIALIYSGGKSIHAIIDVSDMDIVDQDDWNKQIRDDIFNNMMIPLGVDESTHKPCQLSRLAGVHRKDKDAQQTLLYLTHEKLIIKD